MIIMPNPYIGLPLSELNVLLSKAVTAMARVVLGEAIQSIASEEERIAFMLTTAETLERHIAWLRAAIALASGASSGRSKGVYIVTRKGL